MLIASYLTEIRVVKTVTLKIVKVLIYRQLRSTYLFFVCRGLEKLLY